MRHTSTNDLQFLSPPRLEHCGGGLEHFCASSVADFLEQELGLRKPEVVLQQQLHSLRIWDILEVEAHAIVVACAHDCVMKKKPGDVVVVEEEEEEELTTLTVASGEAVEEEVCCRTAAMGLTSLWLLVLANNAVCARHCRLHKQNQL